MGKGKGKRRRQKNVVRSHQGNLHLAARGKACARLPLPPAPKDKDQDTWMPKSLRKLVALQTAHAQSRPNIEANVDQSGGELDGEPVTNKVSGNRTIGRAGEAVKAVNGKTLKDTEMGQDGLVRTSVFDTTKPKKTKEKKKLYLRQKEMKKKSSVKQVREMERNALPVDRVRFGETVDRPLDVQLKRKHWVAKSPGERCKEIFLKQLNSAGAPANDARTKRPSKETNEELKALRNQVISAYREKRNPTSGTATLASLADLVNKSKNEANNR